MKIKFLISIFFFSIIFLFISPIKSFANYNLFYSIYSTNDHVKWEVGMYYSYCKVSAAGQRSCGHTSGVWEEDLTSPRTGGGYYLGYGSVSVPGNREPKKLTWSTACVDPKVKISKYSGYYYNTTVSFGVGPIDVTDRYDVDKPKLRALNSPVSVPFHGFGTGRTYCPFKPDPKPPCPEPKRPKAGWCGTRKNSCGNSRTWTCPGILDCQNHRCVCPKPDKPSGWECGWKKNKCGNSERWGCPAGQGCRKSDHQCIANRYSIAGNVWVDENYSGGALQPAKDTDAEGITVRTANNSTSDVTNSDGEYILDNFPNGDYTIQVNDPGVEYVVETGPKTINVPPDKDSVDFRLTRRFSISGGVFTNTDTNRSRKSASESYRASQTVEISKLTGGVPSSSYTTQTVNSGTGGFTINNLMPGNYRIKYTSLPASGFLMTYPSGAQTADQRYFDVSVGNGRAGTTNCKINGHVQAACQGGSIINLNFGIEAESLSNWYQSVGGNIRVDSGITNVVHDGAGNACSTSTEGYMSAKSTTLRLNDPGIILSGKNVKIRTSTGTQGSRASSKGWLLTNRPFKPAKGSNIRTSYEYLLQNIRKGGVEINALYNSGQPCAGQNRPTCEWSGNFGKGVWSSTVDSDATSDDDTPLSLTIENPGTDDDTEVYNFDSGNTASKKNYIFLVGGDLRIERNINVDPGDTVIFAAKGDIIVTNNVTRIEGIFSAGGDFIVQGSGGPGDSALTIEGSIIANASPDIGAVEGGSFTVQKNLGTGASTGNAVCPAAKIIWRPDFILNAPDALKIRNSTVKEVNSNSPLIAVTNPPTPTAEPTPTPTPTVEVYRPSAQTDDIVIQAEETDGRVGRNGRDWVNRTTWPNGTGTDGRYIITLPDTGANVASGYVNNSPYVKYLIYLPDSWNFPKTYYVHLRGNADADSADSVHVQPNEGTQALGENITFLTQATSGSWDWANRVNQSATGTRAEIKFYNNTSNIHELRIYMKEDGLKIDKIVLRPDSNTSSPSGTGPSGTTPRVVVPDTR